MSQAKFLETLTAQNLSSELKQLAPEADFEFFGAASVKLRVAGVEPIVNADELAITGLPEIARAFPMFWRTFNKLKNHALERKPDAVILIDFPEFNLKLAKSLKKAGFRVIYYISPQIWAWRKYRIKTIRKFVDLLITILPFEKDWYAKNGVKHVEYVGSPLAKEVYSNTSKLEFCAKHAIDPNKPLIALLPGSRHKEISKILPVMFDSSALMLQENPEIQFVIALAATRKIEEVEKALNGKSNTLNFKIVSGETHDLLAAADAAVVASGTATLETAIIGTPFVIVYKVSGFNYGLIRPLIDIEHFGLVNLIAEKRLIKELIQNDFTAESLAAELFRILEKDANQSLRESLKKVAEKLGSGGASKRAAEAVLRLIDK